MQPSRLRASDADREAVAERLRNATAEGRLLAHELEERIARALRARTYGELDAVVADLPANQRSSRGAIPLVRPALAVAIVVAAVLVIAFAVLVITGFVTVWALWALCAWWCFGGRHRRHLRRGARLQVGRHGDRRAWL
jgi:Flp pilus assembly protein TadB